MSWTSIFGDKLVTKAGLANTGDVLGNKKRVGIYFSAHWCPPCRRFTPMLAEFYEKAKAAEADGLEIIFVSADSDQGSFDGYYGEMPWVSTVYGDDVNEALNQRFGVNGIPMFIVLDSNGKAVDKDARSTVTSTAGNVQTCFAKWA